MMKLGTEKVLCAAAVIGACALIVMATHHTIADNPSAAPGGSTSSSISTVASAVAASPGTGTAAARPATANVAPGAGSAAAGSEIDPVQAGKLLSQLQLIRSQFELWKLQHEDRLPDLKRYDKWQQFTARTTVKGELRDAKGSLGPYLTAPPRNALNGLSVVAMSGDDVKPGQLVLDRPAGFLLSLPSGRIFGTDASGKKAVSDQTLDRVYQAQFIAAAARDPLKSGGSSQPETREDRVASLLDQLNTLQAQLLLYKLQHRDALPDLGKLPDWQQLTNRTDAAGHIAEKGEFGPYLRGTPRNPLTGDYRVVLTTAGRKTARQLRDARIGYVLDPRTTQLWAVDEQGKCIAIKRVETGS